jgi:hypothetical protein
MGRIGAITVSPVLGAQVGFHHGSKEDTEFFNEQAIPCAPCFRGEKVPEGTGRILTQ